MLPESPSSGQPTMHLADFLKERRLSQDEFAQKLGVSQGLVSQWVRGVTRITLKQSLQIKRITRNKVTPEDCVDMYVGPPKRFAASEQAQA
jgi:DNA-binding transcriptional regulator YdaS (Cro superfamily)